MPWWLLGISLVATTFSTDTPNLVTDIVRKDGVFGNWVWWAFLLTGMLTVFLYAKLWRRSEVMTDVEFYELRYSGPLAGFLRGFRGAYLGIFFNICIMASVTLAAIKIGGVMMGWTPLQTIVIAALITVIYAALGGLLGVLWTDFFQFAIAMIGSVAAAVYVVQMPEVGGLNGLFSHPNVVGKLDFLPNFATMKWETVVPIFFIPLLVQWWSVYYPGAEPGGGSYVVQRMLSAKDEKHALRSTLAFNAMHYALRPWPWILVALSSLIIFPDLNSIQTQFPHIAADKVKDDLAYSAMLTFLPAGLIGLVVTSLAAAYMSTMSTQLNWGSSIIVNDIYHRFINPQATEKELVNVGRISTVSLMIVACILALYLENALQVFNLVLSIGAGTGLLLILRWYWWRINAEAELTAMIVSLVVSLILQFGVGDALLDWQKLCLGVGITTLSWMVVALITKPTDQETLENFYKKIRPEGKGWQPIKQALSAKEESVDTDGNISAALLSALCGCFAVWGALFCTGFLLYGRYNEALIWGVIAIIGFLGIQFLWSKIRFN